MLAALLLSSALVSMSSGVKPPDYTERSLCELWAGAQCQAAKCGENADTRCKSASKVCRGRTRAAVSKERATKVVECAKALLKQQCGQPPPPVCSGVDAP